MILADLLSDLLPDVTGCPDPVAERALFFAAQRLCAASGLWQVRHDPISVTPGVANYELDVPVAGRLHTVIAVELDGQKLTPSDYAFILHSPDRGQPKRFYVDGAEVALVPTPNAAGALYVTAAYVPAASVAGTLPDVLEEYREALLLGAKATLFAQREQPWTNVQLADYHAQAFQRASSAARIRVATGRAGAALRAAPRVF